MSTSQLPLDIAQFVLRGEASEELKKHLDSTDIMSDHAYLERAHRAVATAEDQVMDYMISSADRALPETVDVWDIGEIATALKKRPVQLATLLADTIILAAGQLETFEKDVRWQAILGIADGIVQQAYKENSYIIASNKIILGLLNVIERRGVFLENAMYRASLHARKLVLQKIADF